MQTPCAPHIEVPSWRRPLPIFCSGRASCRHILAHLPLKFIVRETRSRRHYRPQPNILFECRQSAHKRIFATFYAHREQCANRSFYFILDIGMVTGMRLEIGASPHELFGGETYRI